MYRAVFASLLTAVFVLFVSAQVASAAPAPPAALAATGGADLSPLKIPTVSMVPNGFGVLLADACAHVKTYAPVATPDLTLKAAAIRIATKPPVADAIASKTLDVTAANLKDICDSLSDPKQSLSQSQLSALREIQASGNLPSLSAALAQKPTTPKELLEKVSRGALQGPTPTPTSAFSGLESNAINGLSDFLVTRSKEEAILYLQDKLGKDLCTKKQFDKLLPNICATITGLDESLSIAAMGTALNAAAKRDLVQLPDALLKVGEEKDANQFYIYESLRLVYAIVLDANGGRNPIEVAQSLHGLPPRSCEKGSFLDAPNLDCQRAFLAFRLTSGLLYAAQSNAIDSIAASLAANRPQVVGALLDAEARSNSQRSALAPFQFTPTDIEALTQILARAQAIWKDWQAQSMPITKSLADGKTTVADRRKMLALLALDVTRNFGELTRALQPYLGLTVAQQESSSKAIDLLGSMDDIASNVLQEQYGAALLDGRALIASINALNPPKEFTQVLKGLQSVLPLLSEIASAKSSADVSAALQAAAAPADSYRAKYQRPVVAFGALVGLLGGWERPDQPNNKEALGTSKSSGFVAGLAPVGFEASVNLSQSFYLEGMLSVLDVGALTTARFKSEVSDKDTVNSSTNVTFGQVFSPGFYAALGLAGSPVVIGAGASLAPALRTLEAPNDAGGVTTENLTTLRVGGFIAMDVTIFPL